MSTTTTSTTVAPVAPTTATTAQVAAHHSVLQTILGEIEKLPQTVENAEKYINMQAATTATWIQSKHAATRILEVAAIALAVGSIVGFIVGRFL